MADDAVVRFELTDTTVPEGASAPPSTSTADTVHRALDLLRRAHATDTSLPSFDDTDLEFPAGPAGRRSFRERNPHHPRSGALWPPSFSRENPGDKSEEDTVVDDVVDSLKLLPSAVAGFIEAVKSGKEWILQSTEGGQLQVGAFKSKKEAEDFRDKFFPNSTAATPPQQTGPQTPPPAPAFQTPPPVTGPPPLPTGVVPPPVAHGGVQRAPTWVGPMPTPAAPSAAKGMLAGAGQWAKSFLAEGGASAISHGVGGVVGASTGSGLLGGMAGSGAAAGLTALGTVALPVAAALGGIVVAAGMVKKSFDLLKEGADSLKGIGGGVTRETAIAEVRQIQMLLNRDRKIGAQAAESVKTSSELSTAWEEFKTNLMVVLDAMIGVPLRGMQKLLTWLLEVTNKIFDFWYDVFGIGKKDPNDPFMEILNFMGQGTANWGMPVWGGFAPQGAAGIPIVTGF